MDLEHWEAVSSVIVREIYSGISTRDYFAACRRRRELREQLRQLKRNIAEIRRIDRTERIFVL